MKVAERNLLITKLVFQFFFIKKYIHLKAHVTYLLETALADFFIDPLCIICSLILFWNFWQSNRTDHHIFYTIFPER